MGRCGSNHIGRANRDFFFLHPDGYQADETRDSSHHRFSVGDAMDASELRARRVGFGRMAVSTEDAVVANMNKSPNQSISSGAPLRFRQALGYSLLVNVVSFLFGL